LKCISYLMGYHTCLGGPSSTARPTDSARFSVA
jgi:hypothetical protein